MKTLFTLLFALGVYTVGCAQPYQAPTGAAYDAFIKEYTASFSTRKLDGVKAKLPALQKAYPRHPYTLFFEAWIADQEGDEQAALRGYSDAIRLMPDLSDPYYYRANRFAQKGMYDRAIADMDKIIEVEKNNLQADYFSKRADYKFWNGNAADAFEDFKQAINLQPANDSYYRGMKNTGIKANKVAEAEQVFKTALEGAQSGNAAIRIEYGNLLMKTGKYTNADEQFSKALATPGFEAIATDYSSAGIVAYKLKDYARARTLMSKAAALDPKDEGNYINLASIAIDEQKWEDVYTYAQKAMAINTDNSMANMMMALGVKRTGRGDELAEQYEAKAKKLEAEGK